jgi:autotransporter-associated beta strand protein
MLLLAAADTACAGSATWNLNPTNGLWYTAANWTPATVPNGPNDTATFDISNITQLFNSDDDIEVNGIVFNVGASPFSMLVYTQASYDILLTISGVGITNNSGTTQNFLTEFFDGYAGVIQFTNSAKAGDLTVFTNNDGRTAFFGTSSAGSGTFINNATGSSTYLSGSTDFFNSATAENATVIANGSPISIDEGGQGGLTTFQNTSTAGNAALIATGGTGSLIAPGGNILLEGDSSGGTARVEVFAGDLDNLDGNLDISAHNAPGVTVGSIEGDGLVLLGANNLTVGSNNLSTTFSGVIQDGGIFGGTGGSLTKIGSGTMMLSGANTYTGGTTIDGGKLVVSNRSGSGTGSGAVQVSAGTLGGRGPIAGTVTVGNGNGARAVLAPGRSEDKAGTLTIQSALTFNSDATYNCELKTKRVIADKVVANGVTIRGARFFFVSCGNSALLPGTIFTVIDNTAATAIAGTFNNLADGSTFAADGNTFQVNYEGGDGNDLTLTVVP